jgi:hypothetical protein
MPNETVFVSYRRTDFAWAMAVYQDLARRGFDVFLDYEQVSAGRFEQVILENIRARTHFLLLLTPDALDRCDQPDDWLRREISEAIHSERNIVPLFVHGFDFESPKVSARLTGELVNLRSYNGITLSPEYFAASMEKIHKFLSKPHKTIPVTRLSQAVQGIVERQQQLADIAQPITKRQLEEPAHESSVHERWTIVAVILASVAFIALALW